MSTHPPQSAQPGTLSCTLTLDLEEAATGKVESLRIERLEICEACGGTGQSWRSDDGTCVNCNNKGSFKAEKVFDVRIPAGVENGSRLRLAGEGNAVASQMERGDLYITINVRKHERLERQGRNLRTSVKLTEEEITKGTEVTIITLLDGQKLLSIPPGTASGAVFRLAGLGVRSLESSERGDLLVKVRTQESRSYAAAGPSFTTLSSSPQWPTFLKGAVIVAGLLLVIGFLFAINRRSDSNSSTARVEPNNTPFPALSPTTSYSPTPTPTPYTPTSLPNGTNITPPQGPRGDNSMTIVNGGDSDIAVKVISSSAQKTRRFVYVRASSTAVIKNLARELCLLRWESGTDWDVATRRFRFYRSLHQFDQNFDLQKIRYTVHFDPSPLGTLHESSINESDFEDR